MKCLIIYSSQYKKNTEKIARIFAEKADSHLINAKDINDVDVKDYDLIGFGSGVYNESMSPRLFKIADKLDIKGKNVFVFSTSGAGLKFYNKSLIKLLASKGGIIKGSFACKGSFIAKEFTDNKIFDIIGRLSQGHPNDKDLKKAERFIDRVLESL